MAFCHNRAAGQHQQQVFIGLHTVGLGRFYQRIYLQGLPGFDCIRVGVERLLLGGAHVRN